MAKKVKEKKVHEHKWSVGTEKDEYTYCECESICDCSCPEYAMAECSCGKKLDQCEIEEILNKFANKI